MDIYDTLYMLAAIEELTPEPTFFKRRYFPTDLASDVFGTSKVLADYKEGSRKAAPFVVPRIGALPVGRSGFSTYELEPGNIAISKPLTIDQLTRRGFGESIMSTVTPEMRARRLLMGDLSDLSARVSRTEEWLACETMLNMAVSCATRPITRRFTRIFPSRIMRAKTTRPSSPPPQHGSLGRTNRLREIGIMTLSRW